MVEIRFDRVWAMPNASTFTIKPIAQLLAEEVTKDKYWVDPFARGSKIANLTNDLDPQWDTDYHMDALEFLKTIQSESVDGVLLDAPYGPRQVAEHYRAAGWPVTQETTQSTFWSKINRETSRITKKGGKVISFGWHSGGVGKKLGFVVTRILLVPHGGHHNDTIVTVEVKESSPVL